MAKSWSGCWGWNEFRLLWCQDNIGMGLVWYRCKVGLAKYFYSPAGIINNSGSPI